MLKGVLEGCVLEIIGRNTTYGYDTILVRLEKNGFVETEKIPSEVGPPRKFYTLTDSGKTELQLFWEKWDYVSLKMNELRS